jgi:CBS domain containing-hemolysin-like protein
MNDGPSTPRDNGAQRQQNGPSGGPLTWIRRLIRLKSDAPALRDTIEELIDQEDAAQLEGGEERILLRNILKLRDKSVHDVMVPRADIVAVDVSTPAADLVRLMSETAHSRLPVYRETLDNVVGMVHIKDVVAALERKEGFRLQDLVRRILFIAPSMPILELLLKMRVSRVHMALVVDEFGGIDGLVTIEDLVEEIVGEIEDEHDYDLPPTLTRRDDNIYEVDARLAVEEFENAVGAVLTEDERKEDIDTLGGLVSYLAGRVPGRGEVIRHSSGLEFEVLDADARRVKRLRVCNVSPPAPSAK